MKKVLHIINYQESKIPVTYYYKTSKLIPINDWQHQVRTWNICASRMIGKLPTELNIYLPYDLLCLFSWNKWKAYKKLV